MNFLEFIKLVVFTSLSAKNELYIFQVQNKAFKIQDTNANIFGKDMIFGNHNRCPSDLVTVMVPTLQDYTLWKIHVLHDVEVSCWF